MAANVRALVYPVVPWWCSVFLLAVVTSVEAVDDGPHENGLMGGVTDGTEGTDEEVACAESTEAVFGDGSGSAIAMEYPSS